MTHFIDDVRFDLVYLFFLIIAVFLSLLFLLFRLLESRARKRVDLAKRID